MASKSSLRKSIFKGKDAMHGENIFLDTKAYNKFIHQQSYVDETHLHHLLIIFEPTSTNPIKSQS